MGRVQIANGVGILKRTDQLINFRIFKGFSEEGLRKLGSNVTLTHVSGRDQIPKKAPHAKCLDEIRGYIESYNYTDGLSQDALLEMLASSSGAPASKNGPSETTSSGETNIEEKSGIFRKPEQPEKVTSQITPLIIELSGKQFSSNEISLMRIRVVALITMMQNAGEEYDLNSIVSQVISDFDGGDSIG
jgi:hypothetical protein